ncbi:hypothetical protein FQA47_004044 [Oryzias melastigma]|uniref:Uncharacterized protein n=1 Tax=Oryzias melastigma TaxID=30732 RepID=A0A834CT28_ORYME|nr:hypothetical protein FQA47_004044 [Oryzias melastigma]
MERAGKRRMEELGQQQNIKSTDVITPAGRRDSVSRVEPAKHTRRLLVLDMNVWQSKMGMQSATARAQWEFLCNRRRLRFPRVIERIREKVPNVQRRFLGEFGLSQFRQVRDALARELLLEPVQPGCQRQSGEEKLLLFPREKYRRD